MSNLKLIYNYIGPRGPMKNSDTINLEDLMYQQTGEKDYAHFSNQAPIADSRLAFVLDVEVTTPWQLNPGDHFLFELPLQYDRFDFGYKYPSGILNKFNFFPVVEQGIKEGNGYIYLEFSNEAFFKYRDLAPVQDYFVRRGIPLNKIIYATATINHEELKVSMLENENFELVMQPLYIPAFEIEVSRQNTWVKPEYKEEIIEKKFLCFNRVYRDHRFALLLEMARRDLLDQIAYSFSEINPWSQTDEFDKWVYRIMPLMSTLGIEYSDEFVRSVKAKLPLKVDTDTFVNNLALDHKSLHDIYNRTGISIITETFFFEPELFLSEKTYKPIMYRQPFIILGRNGCLKTLREAGYLTFGAWWDESYDEIENDGERLKSVCNLIETISKWDMADMLKFRRAAKNICEHNYQTLVNLQSASEGLKQRIKHIMKDVLL